MIQMIIGIDEIIKGIKYHLLACFLPIYQMEYGHFFPNAMYGLKEPSRKSWLIKEKKKKKGSGWEGYLHFKIYYEYSYFIKIIFHKNITYVNYY